MKSPPHHALEHSVPSHIPKSRSGHSATWTHCQEVSGLPPGWSRDCRDKQPFETRMHAVVDDGDDDNGAITFASADDDAFAIQDASEPSPSLRESPGLVGPWHHIDIFTNAMKTHCLISILKAKERFEAILHTFQDVTARVFQVLQCQWIVFVRKWWRKVKTNAPQKQHERFLEGKQFTLTETGSIEATPHKVLCCLRVNKMQKIHSLGWRILFHTCTKFDQVPGWLSNQINLESRCLLAFPQDNDNVKNIWAKVHWMIQNAINSPEFQTPESFATVSPMFQLRNVNPSTSQMPHSAGLFCTHLYTRRNNYVNHNLPVTSMISCMMTLLADKMFELNWTSLFGAHYNWTFNQLNFSLNQVFSQLNFQPFNSHSWVHRNTKSKLQLNKEGKMPWKIEQCNYNAYRTFRVACPQHAAIILSNDFSKDTVPN